MSQDEKNSPASGKALIEPAPAQKDAVKWLIPGPAPAGRNGLNAGDTELGAHQILGMVDTIFLILRSDGAVLYINRTGCEATGRSQPDIIGKNWFKEFVPAGYRHHAQNMHMELVSGKIKRIRDLENPLTNAGSGERTILWQQQAIRNQAGKVVGVFYSGQDITGLKKTAEEKISSAKIQPALHKILQISLKDLPLEKILEQIYNHILSIPWIAFEPRGGFWLTENDAKSLKIISRRGLSSCFLKCEKISFGQCFCGRAAATGQVIFAGHKHRQPEAGQNCLPAHAHYCVPIIAKRRVIGVMNFYLKTNHKYDKKEVGFLKAVSGVLANIIERKQAEEEVRRLNELNQKILDNTPVSIAMLDREGRVVALNRMETQLMHQSDEQIIGTKLTDTKEIKENREISALYNSLLAAGQPFYYDNLSYTQSQTGLKKSLNIIAVPLLEKTGQVEGAISMALDNTEAVEAKRKLKDLNTSLERKVEARTRELSKINQRLNTILELKSKFVADASHELRTPLTVIQGNLDLAIREAAGNPGRKVPEFMELIMDEVNRMRMVLTDLTMLTNVDVGTEQLNCEKVNLNDLLQAVGQSLGVLAKQKTISLHYKKNAKNIIIRGDDAKLEKMLLNIVRNGIKYTKPGGRVSVWAEKDEAEARIMVKDNGIGIPAEDLPFIFERFYRVDKARSRNEGGSGLGLAIAKWVAEAHHGSITVQSMLGQGSVFTVHLPIDYRQVRAEAMLF
ncbi:MAG: ATP-binding protein [Planctomycetes bacterium]|nr:ATP-binding protein [Planctomycetota bacterium]